MLSSTEELERFLNRRTTQFANAMHGLVDTLTPYNLVEHEERVRDLAKLIQQTMILSDLHGRKRVLMETDRLELRRKRAKRAARFDLEEGTPIVPRIEFEEAVEDLLTREPRLATGWQEVARLYSDQHVFALARSSDLILTKRIRQAIEDLAAGVAPTDTEQEIMRLARAHGHDFSNSYAALVYRTNVSRAYTEGRFQQAKDPDVKAVAPAFELVGIEDERERPNHRAARGLIADTEDKVWLKIKPPLGYQCFLPETMVSGNFVSALKASYSGPAIQINTNNGCRLSVTVNHPILTRQGWRPANCLREGDDLFCDNRQIKSFNAGHSYVPHPTTTRPTINYQEMPTSVDNVFETFLLNGTGPIFTRTTPFDLHGDAQCINGDVHVVRANRNFFTNMIKSIPQLFKQLNDSTPSMCADFPIHAVSAVDALRKIDFPMFCRNPRSSTLAFQYLFVILSRLSQFPFREFGVRPRPSFNVESPEKAKNRSVVDSEFLTKLTGADASFITPDKIVSIRRFPFDGHVYDFQTESGWILADGILTSNCRHGVNLLDVFELERRGLIKNGQVISYYPPDFNNAHPDPGFVPGRFIP